MSNVSPANQTILLSGMGRSGTTWCSEIINCNNDYRIIFEPFLPVKVPLASGFEYLQYLRPEHCDTALEQSAQKILAGDVHAPWVDREVSANTSGKILVKEIRSNLMLGWLHAIKPDLPIVLMIRHPLQVIDSWIRLGWKNEAFGPRSNFETMVAQKELLADFPMIAETAAEIDATNHFQDMLFQWCIYHHVPLSQLRQGDAYVLFYENLLTDPEHETSKLFNYLDIPFDWKKINQQWKVASNTNYLRRDFHQLPKSVLLNSWQNRFSAEQMTLASKMLSKFGLNRVYDKDGKPLGNPLPTGGN